MLPKERIKKIFAHGAPDRVGIYDLFWNETRLDWCTRLGIEKSDLENYFGIDIVILDDDQIPQEDKFCVISTQDPFEDVVTAIGLENTLMLAGRDPADIISELKKSAAKILKKLERRLAEIPDIDGGWLWADMAGEKGLFFSPQFYKANIFPLHKEICALFRARGIPIIIHSDGNINDIIPDLIEAGASAIHPVESKAGMGIGELKKKYGAKLVFMGNVSLDIIRYKRDREFLGKVIAREIELAKENGSYIFGFENPISPEIDLDLYEFVLNTVKDHGTY